MVSRSRSWFARLGVVAGVVPLFGCEPARPPVYGETAPGVVFPMHLAEGHGDGALGELPPAGSGAPASSGAPGAAPAPSASAAWFSTDPPDPEPLRQTDQYEYTFRYENGAPSLVSVRAVRLPKPSVTARRIGRFAVELWIGHELVDRVRFDFPLLGADEPKRGPQKLYAPIGMIGGPFTATVLVPAAARARRARLVDRAAKHAMDLAWPPAPAALGAPTPMTGPAVNATPAASGSASPSAPPAVNATPAASGSASPSAPPAASGSAPPSATPAASGSTPPSAKQR